MSQLADRNLSSIMRTHQLKTESTASSTKSILSESNNKKSMFQSRFTVNSAKKLPKKSENLYADFNYVKSANNLHREAIELINKPTKSFGNKSERRNSKQLVNLNDIDDPIINVKLNIDSLNPILDLAAEQQNISLENISIRSNEFQKNVQTKMFMNVVKDYDMIGIAPNVESPAVQMKLSRKALNEKEDDSEGKETSDEPSTESARDANDTERVVHFDLEENTDPTDEISLKTGYDIDRSFLNSLFSEKINLNDII